MVEPLRIVLILLQLCALTSAFISVGRDALRCCERSCDRSFATASLKQRQPAVLLRGHSWELQEDCSIILIDEAAEFLVRHFWLETPRHWTDETDLHSEPKNRANLVQEQSDDLMSKYGERLGKKLLKSGLIWIRNDDNEGLGLLALTEVLMQKDDGALETPEQSTERIQSAVATLGPKQRRVFQKVTAREIVEQLLPQYTIVCLVSNLSVAQRRQGLGKQLCQHAETVAKESWGHDRLYLKVEATNEAAMKLYETNGYACEFSVSTDSGVRLDKLNGEFTIQDSVPTLLMSKAL